MRGRVCMLRGYLCKATTAGGLVFQWGTQIRVKRQCRGKEVSI